MLHEVLVFTCFLELILEEEVPSSELLFYKAFGHYRLNEITKAQHTLQTLLDIHAACFYSLLISLLCLSPLLL